jgi:DNA-binding MarR family transcriptional regulator
MNLFGDATIAPSCRHGRPAGDCVFCRARTTDPVTSKAAAHQTGFAKTHKARILAALNLGGPQTQTELAETVGLLPHQVNKRLNDLQKDKLAHPLVETREGHAGRQERLWST